MERRLPVPLSLGKPSLRLRLEAYYAQVAPDLLENDWKERMRRIYAKYGGTHDGEAQLQGKLARKYGPWVDLEICQPPAERKVFQKDVVDTFEASVIEKDEQGSPLDLLSPSFDASLALQQDPKQVLQINPWMKDAPLLDRVEYFCAYLPIDDPLYNSSLRTKTAVQPVVPKPPPKGVYDDIMVTEGPCALLASAVGKFVSIRLRQERLVGNLVAYDRQWNLLIVTSKKQRLVRGDAIVTVHLTEQEDRDAESKYSI